MTIVRENLEVTKGWKQAQSYGCRGRATMMARAKDKGFRWVLIFSPFHIYELFFTYFHLYCFPFLRRHHYTMVGTQDLLLCEIGSIIYETCCTDLQNSLLIAFIEVMHLFLVRSWNPAWFALAVLIRLLLLAQFFPKSVPSSILVFVLKLIHHCHALTFFINRKFLCSLV